MSTLFRPVLLEEVPPLKYSEPDGQSVVMPALMAAGVGVQAAVHAGLGGSKSVMEWGLIQSTLGIDAVPVGDPGRDPSAGITTSSSWCQPAMVSTRMRLLANSVDHLREAS